MLISKANHIENEDVNLKKGTPDPVPRISPTVYEYPIVLSAQLENDMEDEKAIKILLRLHKATPSEKQYVKSVGLSHDVTVISHERGMNWLEEIKLLCKKDTLVKNFLFSLSNRRLNYRAGLAAYAITHKMPWHDHIVGRHEGWCINKPKTTCKMKSILGGQLAAERGGQFMRKFQYPL
jgi:hypothetical protein